MTNSTDREEFNILLDEVLQADNDLNHARGHAGQLRQVYRDARTRLEDWVFGRIQDSGSVDKARAWDEISKKNDEIAKLRREMTCKYCAQPIDPIRQAHGVDVFTSLRFHEECRKDITAPRT